MAGRQRAPWQGSNSGQQNQQNDWSVQHRFCPPQNQWRMGVNPRLTAPSQSETTRNTFPRIPQPYGHNTMESLRPQVPNQVMPLRVQESPKATAMPPPNFTSPVQSFNVPPPSQHQNFCPPGQYTNVHQPTHHQNLAHPIQNQNFGPPNMPNQFPGGQQENVFTIPPPLPNIQNDPLRHPSINTLSCPRMPTTNHQGNQFQQPGQPTKGLFPPNSLNSFPLEPFNPNNRSKSEHFSHFHSPGEDRNFTGNPQNTELIQEREDTSHHRKVMFLSDDKQWIDNWLKKIGKSSTENYKDQRTDSEKASSSISEADSRVRTMMLLMAQLQQQTKSLKTMITDSGAEWEEQVKITLDLKNQLKHGRKSLQDDDTLAQLKRKVEIRRKKRERIKRKRKREYEEKQEMLQRREELHNKLDAWQEERRLEIQQKKQEEEMKKSADEILNEVRKKIADTTKFLELQKGLQKLRKLRRDRLNQQGVFSNPSSDEKFDSVICKQFDILTKQKETYLAEERALMVMLETEQEDNKEKEREKANAIEKQKQEKQERKEREMLFGNPDFHKEGDVIYPFYQYYDQTNYSYDSFLQIRREWDSFIVPPSVPGGSRIPDGWILPPEPSSMSWASVLKDYTDK